MNINTIIIYNSSKLVSAYELYEHQLNLKVRIHYIMTMRAVHRYHGYHIGTYYIYSYYVARTRFLSAFKSEYSSV